MRTLSLLFLFFLQLSSSYKILVYNSKFGHSHSNFLGSIADILVEAGHNVTSLIPVLNPSGKDGTSKSNVIHVELGEKVHALHEESIGGHKIFFGTPYFDMIGFHFGGQAMSTMFAEACKKTLENDEIIDRLKNEKFDVMFAESFDMCGMGLSHLIQPKSYIALLTMNIFGNQYDELCVPPGLSFVPSAFTRHLDVHSITDRALNLVAEFGARLFFTPTRTKLHDVFKAKYGKDFPSFKELSSNAAYIFSNFEPLLDFGAPSTSRLIPIGGLGAKQPKPLDGYWQGVMDKRNRVVLISFGSITPSKELPEDRKQSLLKVISHFSDVTFVWKYEDTDDSFARTAVNSHPNLVLSKWMPQNDLLNHPHISAFITHGGMGSCMEVAQRAVPALLVPLFGDQPKNAWAMEYNGLGKVLSKFDLTKPDIVIATLKDVMENPKYRENARKVSKKLAQKPFSSRDLVIKYTEFAAAYGPSRALRPQSCDMNFIEYHNLDIVVISILITLVMLVLLAKVTCCCVRGKKSSRKEKRA